MSSPAVKRLMKDFEKLKSQGQNDIIASPNQSDLFTWTATIVGPLETIWQDGTFTLSIKFPLEYPNKAPDIRFTTEMFHPNIYKDGSICLDMLKKDWNPSYDTYAVLSSIRILLGEPNPSSPANNIAAQLYQNNRKEYERRVQKIIEASFQDDQQQQKQ